MNGTWSFSSFFNHFISDFQTFFPSIEWHLTLLQPWWVSVQANASFWVRFFQPLLIYLIFKMTFICLIPDAICISVWKKLICHLKNNAFYCLDGSKSDFLGLDQDETFQSFFGFFFRMYLMIWFWLNYSNWLKWNEWSTAFEQQKKPLWNLVNFMGNYRKL